MTDSIQLSLSLGFAEGYSSNGCFLVGLCPNVIITLRSQAKPQAAEDVHATYHLCVRLALVVQRHLSSYQEVLLSGQGHERCLLGS